jgi:hypothetical protein
MECYDFESIEAFVHSRFEMLFPKLQAGPVASPARRML